VSRAQGRLAPDAAPAGPLDHPPGRTAGDLHPAVRGLITRITSEAMGFARQGG
jgi:hypothetical protein